MLKQRLFFVLLVVATFCALGCQSNCDWIKKVARQHDACDPIQETDDAETDSVQVTHRGWDPQLVYYDNGAVQHRTSYMNSCYDIYGSQNDQTGTWQWEDLVSMSANPFIFLGDIVYAPVSIVQQPPWQYQSSRSLIAEQDAVYDLPNDSFIPTQQ